MLKKQWNKPQIFQLGVEYTQGGTVYDSLPDGDPWYDAEHKCWQTPSGHNS